MIEKKRWEDLTVQQRTAISIMGTLQVTLLVAALLDMWRRPPEQIQGNRVAWSFIALINFFGPIAYFLFGRRKP